MWLGDDGVEMAIENCLLYSLQVEYWPLLMARCGDTRDTPLSSCPHPGEFIGLKLF